MTFLVSYILPPPFEAFRQIASLLGMEAAQQPVTPEMVTILKSGHARLQKAGNVAMGYGRAVWILNAKGYLKQDRYENGVTYYFVTPEGRAELERQRVDALARIGVYEVRK